MTLDKIVTDRTVEMNHWADYCWRTMKRGVEVYVYVNNYYAGYAPATIQKFRAIWNSRNLALLKEQPLVQKARQQPQTTLFDL